MTKPTLAELQTVSLFAGLTAAQLGPLGQMSERVVTEGDDALLEESTKGTDIFAIVAGRVSIEITLPGDKRKSEEIAVLKAGDMLGESVLLGRQRRIASAVAQGEVTSLKWDVEKLNAHFDKDPSTGYVVMRNLARILQERLSATNMMLRQNFTRAFDFS